MESEECEASILSGLRHGYRMIDTAEAYANEEAVGNAIAKSGSPTTSRPRHKGELPIL